MGRLRGAHVDPAPRDVHAQLDGGRPVLLVEQHLRIVRPRRHPAQPLDQPARALAQLVRYLAVAGGGPGSPWPSPLAMARWGWGPPAPPPRAPTQPSPEARAPM